MREFTANELADLKERIEKRTENFFAEGFIAKLREKYGKRKVFDEDKVEGFSIDEIERASE